MGGLCARSGRRAKSRSASSQPKPRQRRSDRVSSEFSFDIVSRVDKQNLTDAVEQAKREIATRFDFRNSKSSIDLADMTITIVADDDLKLRNVVDILQSKCVKRGVSLKAL